MDIFNKNGSQHLIINPSVDIDVAKAISTASIWFALTYIGAITFMALTSEQQPHSVISFLLSSDNSVSIATTTIVISLATLCTHIARALNQIKSEHQPTTPRATDLIAPIPGGKPTIHIGVIVINIMCIVWMTYVGDNNTQIDITIALLSANIIYVLSNEMTLNVYSLLSRKHRGNPPVHIHLITLLISSSLALGLNKSTSIIFNLSGSLDMTYTYIGALFLYTLSIYHFAFRMPTNDKRH